MDYNQKNHIVRRNWIHRLTICVLLLSFGFGQNVFSQAISVSESGSNSEVEALVEGVLLGSCVTVSNVTYTGPYVAAGTFDGTGTILGINGGILLTSGRANIAVGPDGSNNARYNHQDFYNDNNYDGEDPDLTVLATIPTRDAVILEFDFIPQNDTLRFNYIFASEEYPEYVNAGYNDAFGFFISGPGISGPFTNGAENIALIPGTTTPVTIDNVNNGYSATEPSSGPCNNCAYYVDNSSGPAVEYDGYTTVLTAEAVVTPCLTHHIKLAVADAGDHIYDSGVFLEGGSFSAGGGVTVDIETSNIPPGIYEGCNDAWFVFRRVDLNNNGSPITATYTVTGTATPGVDYAAITNSITIPGGQDSILVNLDVFLDFVTEGAETIIITMDDPPCTCLAPATATITILDNDIPLAVSTTGTTTICLGQSANLTANPSGSQTPYTSGWNNGAPTGNNVTVSPTTTTTYIYTVTDNCGGQSVNSSETITVIRPDFTIDDDQQCFDGNSFSFTNTGATGGSVTHFWNFGNGNTSTSESPTYSYPASGNYTVTHNVIYTASACTASATAAIVVFDEPILTSSLDQNAICVGGTDGAISTSLSGGTSAFNYIWSPNGETTTGLSNLGVGTYSVTVTDANGCTDNASEIVIQNDAVDPTAICQNITVQLNSGGIATISATQVNNGSSDNCGIASMVVSPNAFDCNDIGGNAVVLTVTDVDGNTSTCNATVTVEDNIDPTAVCQNITVQLDAAGNATITVADVNNGSSDNCSVSVSATPLSFTCADVGANTVVLTATDGSGNTST
ncbi:MAG: choice-of-anchor L domain-containing protein, partial [Flavobacteriales bacterium]|nr:choice-of-anchor L domain-containing protein [Flavobacteriales bacterium]